MEVKGSLLQNLKPPFIHFSNLPNPHGGVEWVAYSSIDSNVFFFFLSKNKKNNI